MRRLKFYITMLAMMAEGACLASSSFIGLRTERLESDVTDRARLNRYVAARREIYDANHAMEFLRKVKYPSPYLPWALLEASRWLYKSGRWSEFFGVASYARQVFPEAPQTTKLMLLETLALVRHCQWKKALGLLANELDTAKGLSRENGETLKAIVELIRDLPAESVERGTPENHSGSIPMAYRWSAKRLALSKLDPYRLRRPISPQCQGERPL